MASLAPSNALMNPGARPPIGDASVSPGDASPGHDYRQTPQGEVDIIRGQSDPSASGSVVQKKSVQFEDDEAIPGAEDLAGEDAAELAYEDLDREEEEALDDEMDDEPTMARASASEIETTALIESLCGFSYSADLTDLTVRYQSAKADAAMVQGLTLEPLQTLPHDVAIMEQLYVASAGYMMRLGGAGEVLYSAADPSFDEASALADIYRAEIDVWAAELLAQFDHAIAIVEAKSAVGHALVGQGIAQLMLGLQILQAAGLSAEVQWLKGREEEIKKAIEALPILLEQAHVDVRNAWIQAGADTALTAITLASGPYAPLVGIFAAVASSGLDYWLNGEPNAVAYANNALGGASGVITEKGATAAMAAQAKRLNRASTAITALLDVKGIVDATQEQKVVHRRVASFAESLPRELMSVQSKLADEQSQLRQGIAWLLKMSQAVTAAKAAMGTSWETLQVLEASRPESLGVVEPMPPVT